MDTHAEKQYVDDMVRFSYPRGWTLKVTPSSRQYTLETREIAVLLQVLDKELLDSVELQVRLAQAPPGRTAIYEGEMAFGPYAAQVGRIRENDEDNAAPLEQVTVLIFKQQSGIVIQIMGPHPLELDKYRWLADTLEVREDA